MKKIIYTAILSLITIMGVSQNIDSTYYWTWVSSAQLWRLESKAVNITYNANNNITSRIIKKITNGVWEIDSKETITYDANNNKEHLSITKWDGVSWINSEDYFFTYDANNNETSNTSRFWNTSDNHWQYDTKTVKTYINNKITSIINSKWVNGNWINGNWENTTAWWYTYYTNGNLSYLENKTWNTSSFSWKLTSHKHLYAYNANNKIISDTTYNYDTNGNPEEPTRHTYTYDTNNNEIYELSEIKNANIWDVVGRIISTYDVNNNRLTAISQNWNATDNVWENFMELYSSYTNDNLVLGNSSLMTFNFVFFTVQNGDSLYNYYATPTSIKNKFEEEKVSIYPNPNNGTFIITSDNMESNTVAIIYNSLGEEVYQQKITQLTETIHTELINGAYQLKLINNKEIKTKKIIINR